MEDWSCIVLERSQRNEGVTRGYANTRILGKWEPGYRFPETQQVDELSIMKNCVFEISKPISAFGRELGAKTLLNSGCTEFLTQADSVNTNWRASAVTKNFTPRT